MNKDIFQFVVLFLVMVLVQVLICNHIAVFDVAMPIVFIYFIIRLPISLGLSVVFTLSFLLGLVVDIFSDTPGVNALACTLVASLRRPIYYAYVPRDDKTKDLIPSISSLGLGVYGKYLISLVSIYCFLAFSIEYFNFADVEEVVLLAVSSSVLTFISLLAFDCLIISKK